MTIAEALRRVAAMKLPPEATAEVVAIITELQDADEVRRAKQRARKQRSRDKSVTVTGQSRDSHGTSHDVVSPSAAETTNSVSAPAFEIERQRSPPTPPSKDPPPAAAAARAMADGLGTKVLAIFGMSDPDRLPGWCGLEGWIEARLCAGWNSELILVGARTVAARRRRRGQGPPAGFNYLEPAIVEAHQRAEAPPPIIRKQREMPLVQVVGGTDEAARRTGPVAGWQQRRDAARDAHTELKERLREPTSPGRSESG